MTYSRQSYGQWASNTGDVVRSPEGAIMPIPKRNRRGRKGRSNISHPLKNIRLSRGFTLEELSEIAGMSPSYLSRLESGSRRLNVDTINRLAHALKCQPSVLLLPVDRWGYNHSDDINATQPHAANSIPDPHGYGQRYGAGYAQGYGAPQGNYPGPNYQKYQPHTSDLRRTIPVFGPAQPGGPIDFTNVSGTVSCPLNLLGVPGVYALRITDDTMSPRYRRGECVIVYPGRPLSQRCVAAVITPTDDVIIGEFVAWRHINDMFGSSITTPNQVINPETEFAIELMQYSTRHTPQGLGIQTCKDDNQVIVHPSQISSVGRVMCSSED